MLQFWKKIGGKSCVYLFTVFDNVLIVGHDKYSTNAPNFHSKDNIKENVEDSKYQTPIRNVSNPLPLTYFDDEGLSDIGKYQTFYYYIILKCLYCR